MKKYILASISVLIFMITSCSIESNQSYIAKQLNLDIPDVLNIEHMDDHGGFHGDGERLAKMEFDNKNGSNILSQIKKDDRWKEMPLTENLNLIIYGGVKGNVEYAYNLAEKSGIPEIKNGYWYFKDRHSESKQPEKDTELIDRHSFNFTISMYDAVNNILYYYEFDT